MSDLQGNSGLLAVHAPVALRRGFLVRVFGLIALNAMLFAVALVLLALGPMAPVQLLFLSGVVAVFSLVGAVLLQGKRNQTALLCLGLCYFSCGAATGVAISHFAPDHAIGTAWVLAGLVCLATVITTVVAALLSENSFILKYGLVGLLTVAVGGILFWYVTVSFAAFVAGSTVLLFVSGYLLYRVEDILRQRASEQVVLASLDLQTGIFMAFLRAQAALLGHDD